MVAEVMEKAVEQPSEAKPPVTPHRSDIVCNELMNTMAAMAANVKTGDQQWAALETQLSQEFDNYPHHRGFQYLMGTLFMMTGRSSLGISMLRYCMQPQLEKVGEHFQAPSCWVNLAAAYKGKHFDDLAEECYKAALAAAGNEKDEAAKSAAKAGALHGLSSLYINRGMPDKVMEFADKALSHLPTDRFALWNKGLAHLEKGEFGPGFDLYDEAGFMEGMGKPRDRKLKEYGGRLKRWSGEKGVKVVVYGEQGVGDEIMFFSMLPDIMKDCQVIIECDPRIMNILKVSFPGVPIYPTSGIDDPFDWLNLPENRDCTHFVPCGSLGRYYRRKHEDFPRTPYFKAEPWLVDKWARVLSETPRPRIGISWAGGLQKTRFDKRTIKLEKLRPVFENDATFFSLQYHPIAADEVAKFGAEIGKPIFHWNDVIGGKDTLGYSETAGFLKNLDLVITVNTSLVHLCGSLGVPTLCLTPVMRAWRYGGKSGTNYWYGSVEQINQHKDDDWEPVIKETARRVARLVERVKSGATKEAA